MLAARESQQERGESPLSPGGAATLRVDAARIRSELGPGLLSID